MTRIDRAIQELAEGPRTIQELTGLLSCSEVQARSSVANLINRILVTSVDGTRPLQYRLTERGREYVREGRINHPWARGYKGMAEQRSAG